MKKIVLAMIIAAASAVPAAAVVTITQTVNSALPGIASPGGSNFNVNFAPFTTPGVYLTSVTLTYSAGFSASFNVVNSNSGGVASRQITLDRGISSAITGNGFSLSDSDTISKTFAVARGGSRNFGNYNPVNSQTATILSGFAPFTSGPVVFAFTSNNIQDISGTPNLGSTVANLSPGGVAAGEFTLTYTAVPEPASWMMMIVGFGLVGFGARRRTLAIG